MIGIILLAVWSLLFFIVCGITENYIGKNCLKNPRVALIGILCWLIVNLGYSIGYYILIDLFFLRA